jgi:hypothetical protein
MQRLTTKQISTLHIHNEIIPIFNKINPIYTLRPRSKTLIELVAQNPEINEGVIANIQILPDVYLSRTLAKVLPANKVYATIVNNSTY